MRKEREEKRDTIAFRSVVCNSFRSLAGRVRENGSYFLRSETHMALNSLAKERGCRAVSRKHSGGIRAPSWNDAISLISAREATLSFILTEPQAPTDRETLVRELSSGKP